MIGEAYVRLRSDDSGYKAEVTKQVTRDLAGVNRQVASTNSEVTKLGRGALYGSGALKGLGRAAASASAAFLGGAGIIYGIKTASAAASNLNEQTSKSAVVFGQSQDAIVSWSKNSAQALGLAHDQAIQAAAGFGALLRPLGQTEEAAAANSERLTQLAADLASFSNTSVADALQALSSGLVGEIEPLRRYGVILSETAVQQKALAMTGKDSVKQLTAQEKVAARLEIIFRQTSQAQGDFARTSGGLANQQRILEANLRDLAATAGHVINPILLKNIKRLNDYLADPANQKNIQKQADSIGGTLASAFDDLAGAIKDANRAWGDFNKGAEKLPGDDQHGFFKTLLTGTLLGQLKAFRETNYRLARDLGLMAEEAPKAAAGLDTYGQAISRLFGALTGTAPDLNFFDDATRTRTVPGKVKGGGFVGRPLTAAEQLAIALATNPNDVQALQAQRAQYQKALDYAQRQVDLEVGNTKQWADDIAFKAGQIQQINEDLNRIATDKAAKADAARLAAIAKLIPNAISGQGIAAGAFAKFQAAVARAAGGNPARNSLFQLPGSNPGLVAGGNIDINNRPVARNADGSISTVASFSISVDGREILIPTVVNGRVVSMKEAIDHYFKTGQNLGSFSSAAAANAYAQRLHEQQASIYRSGFSGKGKADISSALGQSKEQQEASLRTQIAEAQVSNDKKLIPFLQTEAKLAQDHLSLLKKVGASTIAQLQETLNIAQLRRRIRDINKQSQDDFSIQDLFGEGGKQFAAYGSNVAPLTQPLSRQEAGGAAVRAAQAGKTIHITQNFIGARDAAQAIHEAANAARALR